MTIRQLYFAMVIMALAPAFGCGPEEGRGSIEKMTDAELATAIKEHLASSYPDIHVRVAPWHEDPSRTAVYFEEETFSVLYPQQRHHYLIHNIPDDFFKEHLSESVWFELAPGEKPEDLRYPDEELMESVAPDVMGLLEQSGFFVALDGLMAPEDATLEGEPCHGDFRITKRILASKGFRKQGGVDEVFDVCHVLMTRGAFCDCEVLYNAHAGSRLAARHWQRRAKEMAKPSQ